MELHLRRQWQLIDTLDLPNGAYIDNAYDSMARLEDTRLKTSGGTTRNHHSYEYNRAHRRTRQDYTDGSYSTYGYDEIGQVTSVRYYAVGTISYDYDEAWNLDERTVFGNNEDFSVDNLNQLTSSPLGTPSYDDNGNLEDDGQATYTYNGENQLVQIEWGGGSYKSEFTYDGKGRLRLREEYDWNGSSWDLVETVRYIYDGMRVVQERNASNAVGYTYTRGPDLSGTLEGAGGIGGLLGLSTTTTTLYYHADGNGNVTALLSTSQSLAGSYKYDAYGNVLDQSGYWAGVNPYRFSSKERMDSGLYYYGYRFYHPNLQRWINRDPLGEPGFETLRQKRPDVLGDDPNRYRFVQNNPPNATDNWGLQMDPGYWKLPPPDYCPPDPCTDGGGHYEPYWKVMEYNSFSECIKEETSPLRDAIAGGLGAALGGVASRGNPYAIIGGGTGGTLLIPGAICSMPICVNDR